jgi:hypothetical protein
MSFVPGRRSQAGSAGTCVGSSGADHPGAPGKRTLTEGLVVQRKTTGSPDAAPDPGAAVAAAATSTGMAPDPGMRSRVEQVTGADLSGVRVHTGAQSHAAAHGLSARAFTVGQNVHFASGQYQPGSADGNRLLAHELAHTVQQGSSAGAPQCKLEVSQPGDAAEVEADAVAAAATGAGGPVAVTQHRGVMLQRRSTPTGRAAARPTRARSTSRSSPRPARSTRPRSPSCRTSRSWTRGASRSKTGTTSRTG